MFQLKTFWKWNCYKSFWRRIDSDYTPNIDINNIYYPVITNEISTGFVDTSNYLTSLTVGLLEDLGFM